MYKWQSLRNRVSEIHPGLIGKEWLGLKGGRRKRERKEFPVKFFFPFYLAFFRLLLHSSVLDLGKMVGATKVWSNYY